MKTAKRVNFPRKEHAQILIYEIDNERYFEVSVPDRNTNRR